MNSYNSTRYPLIRSVSSPTPTSQMGGVVGPQGTGGGGGGGAGGGMENSSAVGSRDQMPTMLATTTATSSTPPPASTGNNTNSSTNSSGVPAAAGGAGGGGSGGYPSANNSTGSSSASSGTNNNRVGTTVTSTGIVINREQVYTWIQELSSLETREHALIELSRKREVLPDLAPMLWHSFGTIAALLQEIVTIYPVINPPTLNAQQSNRVCNALALLQCVASHPETRSAFLNAHIPLFLYPFLHTVSKSRPFEYLRLTSLGVVGALVKTDEQDVINFLLTTEIIPLCLRIMESGSELSKTVATFILQKILLDETGLSYICQTFERFSHVASVLDKMVQQLGKEPSTRLLKHVVRCYLRLSDNLRAREALRTCLPEQLKDSTFAITLKDDSTTKKWLSQLLQNLGIDGQIAAAVTTTTASAVAITTAASTSQ